MTARPPDEAPPPAAVRRRVQGDDPASREGRTGCIALGAGLGIVAGILFTFFGLPPLLDHFFGETTVDLGETFDADGKLLRAVAVRRAGEAWEVVLSATANKTWRPIPSDFELELDNGKRLKAAAPEPSVPATALEFELGKQRELVLRFAGAGSEGVPKLLHLARPQVAFDLPVAGAP